MKTIPLYITKFSEEKQTDEGAMMACALLASIPMFILFGALSKYFIGGAEVYEGQIIGIHSRSNDLTVNCLQGKKLTNMRASGKDDAIALTTPIKFSLEQAIEFIDDDELVEITPQSIRIRKKLLTETDRKRANRTTTSTSTH